MSSLERMVAWTRVVVKDTVRGGTILEIKVHFGDILGLADGLNVESKGKKEIKIAFCFFT